MIKRIFILATMTIVMVACSAPPAAQKINAPGTPVPNRVGAPQTTGSPAEQPQSNNQLQVILVPSELIVGQNRFAIGLIDSKRGMLHDAMVHLRYFDLSDPAKPAVESEADATRLQTPDGATTIYAHEREFKHAGAWGVEAQAYLSDGTNFVKRISFQVVANSAMLKPGMKAPALVTRTVTDVGGDLKKLSSAVQPNPAFYRLSLAQALSNGKPTVLLFATPAFCQTRLCGPSYETLDAIQKKHGDAINFVHVEVYTGLPNPAANNWQLDPAMAAFGLDTEPWAFLIDKTGSIVYRVEGLFTQNEIEQHLKPLLGL